MINAQVRELLPGPADDPPTSQSLPEVGTTPAESLLLQDKRWTFVCNCVWHSGNLFGQSDFPLSRLKPREWQSFQVQRASEPTTGDKYQIKFAKHHLDMGTELQITVMRSLSV